MNLSPFPVWNQLNDWTVDPDGTDENKYDNCGPECVAMCLKYITGVELSADFLKDRVYGQGYKGYTFVRDWIKFLVDQCEITTVQLTAEHKQNDFIEYLSLGFPLIILRYFDLKKPESGHFIVAFGYDKQGFTYVDPLGGYVKWEDNKSFMRYYKQDGIVPTRQRFDAGGTARGVVRASKVLGLKEEEQTWLASKNQQP